jgi:hypothetical protein
MNRAYLRYYGAFTPGAWLTSRRVAGDNPFDGSTLRMVLVESHVVSGLIAGLDKVEGAT